MNQLSFQSPTQAPVPMPVPASPTQQAIAAPAGAQYIDRCTQRLAIEIGERVKATLVQLGTLSEDARIAVVPYPDRALCIIDPAGVRNINKIYSDNTRHQLKTALKGRRVVLTNTRGVYIQVAWQPEPYIELKAAPIDWASQPSPMHVPISITRQGPLWMSIEELDSVLIGGARRMGKSTLLHSWIQALQQGGKCKLVLFDGKANVEFGDYARPDTVAAEDLGAGAGRCAARGLRAREALSRRACAQPARVQRRGPRTSCRPSC